MHEYDVMTNHYHLVIDTPEPTISRGMQWLNGTYVQWFNKTHAAAALSGAACDKERSLKLHRRCGY